jgi:starch phosphorylase
VQLILAGKAHPQDEAGKELIRRWSDFIRRADVANHVVFLSDYDMLLTQQLVQGVDVWINTPRRPWEASGTSGMKVLVNGGLNLSELDGWWAEAYSPDLGWAIGDGREHGDDPAWDHAEAMQLYELLEQQVIPEFYNRDGDGIPHEWVARMRESMARLAPYYSANRTVRQYTDSHYAPAAQAYCNRAADGGKAGAALLEWQRALAAEWHEIRFHSVEIRSTDRDHQFTVEMDLGGVDPESLLVEIYANPKDGDGPVRQPMKRGERVPNTSAYFKYSAAVPSDRPAGDYTPRARPMHAELFLPLEAPQILWQR